MDIVKILLQSRGLKRWLRKKGVEEDALNLFRSIIDAHQPSEVSVPSELFPIFIRQLGLGLLNHLAIQPNPDWVWPFWVERQYDPTSNDFLSRGHQILHNNMTHRNWTAVGLPDDPDEGVVDPRGAVMPFRGGWSLDFWLQENGRHFCPSRLKSVRQELEANLPLVRTSFHSDGFEAETLAFRARIDGCPVTAVACRVSNIAAAPRKGSFIAAVRPFNAEGLAPIRRILWTGSAFQIDGGSEAAFLAAPDRIAFANESSGDLDQTLDAPLDDGTKAGNCRMGMASAGGAFDLNLEAGQSRRFDFLIPSKKDMLPPGILDKARAVGLDRLREETVRLWKTRLEGTAVLELPDPHLQKSWEANKAWLLALCDGDSITPGPFTYHHFWFRDAAYQVSALDKAGFRDEARKILESYPSRQKSDGFFISQNGEWDANGQAIWALAHHEAFEATPDEEFLRRVYPAVRKGAEWVDAKRCKGKAHKGKPHSGLLPAGFSAEHFGPNDFFYWDDFWCLAGVREAAVMAARLGHAADAARFRALHDEFRSDIERALKADAERLGRPLIPASPYRRMNSGAIGALCAVYPLDLMEVSEPRFENTLQWLREKSFFEDGFFQNMVHSGVNGYLSMQYAQCLIRKRDPYAWSIARWVLEHASPTFTWPEAIHPRTLGGVMGDGHHGWAAADWLHLVRNLVFVEEKDRLCLLPLPPEDWMKDGARVAVRNAPGRFGTANFQARTEKNRTTLDLDFRFREGSAPREISLGLARKAETVYVDGAAIELSKTRECVFSPAARRVEVVFE